MRHLSPLSNALPKESVEVTEYEMREGQEASFHPSHPLWKYLRDSMWQGQNVERTPSARKKLQPGMVADDHKGAAESDEFLTLKLSHDAINCLS